MDRSCLSLALFLLAACGDAYTPPEMPRVQLIPQNTTTLPEYLQGAGVWSAFGFQVDWAPSGLVECARHWYRHIGRDDEAEALACQITIGVVVDPLLVEEHGTDALANREDRAVYVDDSLADEHDPDALAKAIAHEVGHVLLDTPLHTPDGVMSGWSLDISEADRALACDSIGACW